MAIDPGTTHSAYVLMEKESYRPIESGFIPNGELLRNIKDIKSAGFDFEPLIIEIMSYQGMGVGQSTFDTCIWIGRFHEAYTQHEDDVIYVKRRQTQLNLCGTIKAGDTNVRKALISRFAPEEANFGKGTKANPGWFYGFKDHIWQAYATGVTGLDMMKGISI